MAQQSNLYEELSEITRQQRELINQQQETIKFQQNIMLQFQEAASSHKHAVKQDSSYNFQLTKIERQLLAQSKSLNVLRQTVAQHQKWFLEFKDREEDRIFSSAINEESQNQGSGNEMNTSVNESLTQVAPDTIEVDQQNT